MYQIPIKIKHSPTLRQESILKTLVERYIQTGKPVSSEEIKKLANLDVSSATIRIELAHLEKQGLVYHPYSSAGRFPTNYGYRYFVQKLTKDEEISWTEKEKLIAELIPYSDQYNELVKKIVQALSEITSQVALATLPNGEIYKKGLVNFLKNEINQQQEDIFETIEAIENFEQYSDLFLEEISGYKIYIGDESPLEGMDNYCLALTDYQLGQWQTKGIIGVLGNKRIPYHKIKPFLVFFADFLNGKVV